MNKYNKGLFAEYFLMFLLILKGYKIIARRFKTSLGEIDLIASKQKNLKIFEVKSRNENFELGSDNVSFNQTKRIENATRFFLSKNKNILTIIFLIVYLFIKIFSNINFLNKK